MSDGHATPDRIAELPKKATVEMYVAALGLMRQHYSWKDIVMVEQIYRMAEEKREQEATRS